MPVTEHSVEGETAAIRNNVWSEIRNNVWSLATEIVESVQLQITKT